MGRGVRAAAMMGQLRATIRAYARLDLPPASLLALLDTAVRETSDSTIVTCIYAVYDAATQSLTYANAGHMPPLLTQPGVPMRRLTAGDPPLGTGCYRGDTETVPWLSGDRLTLYTDGLVEHRGSDIDIGIDALERVLDGTDAPVEALPSVLVDALLPHEPDDDVAILAATLRRADPGKDVVLPVPPVEASVASARETAGAALSEWAVDDETEDDALLIVSELLTNAIRHGAAPIELRVRLADEDLVINVSDCGTKRPVLREIEPTAPSGRGLHLVDALASRWGTRPTGSGKSVWCTLSGRLN